MDELTIVKQRSRLLPILLGLLLVAILVLAALWMMDLLPTTLQPARIDVHYLIGVGDNEPRLELVGMHN